MSSETFLRLPEEKRSRFLEAAWQEFTEFSFADASISRIVRHARIPRGSFYQYFVDKEDLFTYLLGLAREHIFGAYHSMVVSAKGDLFKAQVLCYDRFVLQASSHADVIFDRCLMILRKNSGFHLKTLLTAQSECMILDTIWDDLDTRMLRSQERTYVRNVFLLTLLALAAMVGETLSNPERAEENRALLINQLDIIRQGSLAERE